MDKPLSEDVERLLRSHLYSGRLRSEHEVIEDSPHVLQEQAQESPESGISEDEFERQMMDFGFLCALYGPRPVPPSDWNFTPIVIEGEPLSETIIRERR